MPQSLAKILIHITFSTKNRRPFLNDQEIRKKTYAYIASVLKRHASPALVIGGADDHIHVLIALSRTTTLAKIVGEIKRSSCNRLKSTYRVFSGRAATRPSQ